MSQSPCRMAERRLTPELVEIDRRLWAWAEWARSHKENIGWPGTSVAWRMMRDHEIGATIHSDPAPIHIPEPVALMDRLVGKLHRDMKRAVMANYFSVLPIEFKARHARMRIGQFKRALDNARWTLYVLIGEQ